MTSLRLFSVVSFVLATIVAQSEPAEPVPKGPNGLYCVKKTVNLLIMEKTVRVAAEFNREKTLFSFKSAGDVVINTCKNNFYNMSDDGTLILDTDWKSPCVSDLEELYDTKYIVDKEDRAKPPQIQTSIGISIATSVIWDEETDTIEAKGVNVPLLGEVGATLSKANCRRFGKLEQPQGHAGL